MKNDKALMRSNEPLLLSNTLKNMALRKSLDEITSTEDNLEKQLIEINDKISKLQHNETRSIEPYLEHKSVSSTCSSRSSFLVFNLKLYF